MKVGFVLHLYQPPTQSESVLRQVASECYLPLVKLIKERRDFNLTLNIPLSLVELMDKYGYSDWIVDIKELVKAERVELVGSSAYHAILSLAPVEFSDKQIILNE